MVLEDILHVTLCTFYPWRDMNDLHESHHIFSPFPELEMFSGITGSFSALDTGTIFCSFHLGCIVYIVCVFVVPSIHFSVTLPLSQISRYAIINPDLEYM